MDGLRERGYGGHSDCDRRAAKGVPAPLLESYHWAWMGDNLLGPIERAASAFGLELEQGVTEAVAAWLDRLVEWNARMDLTAARSTEELVDLMLADALMLSGFVAPGARVVDVGAGAGAPGLALALLRPDLRVTLAEPLGKRASFLRAVIGAIERTDIAIERARGEALSGRRAWDVAISRATLPAAQWLDLGAKLVVPGGAVWVLLAKDAPPEQSGAVAEEDHAYRWPLTAAHRRAVRFRV